MLQNTLPGMEISLANRKHTAVGRIGEQWLAQRLEHQGLKVVIGRPGEDGDLRAIDPQTGIVTKIEVKTARAGKDGKWRFTLWKKGHTDHRRSDVVVLLAATISGKIVPFVVPVHELEKKSHAVITSHPLRYGGKLAKWRQLGRHLQLLQ